jgi:hypothetical protein
VSLANLRWTESEGRDSAEYDKGVGSDGSEGRELTPGRTVIEEEEEEEEESLGGVDGAVVVVAVTVAVAVAMAWVRVGEGLSLSGVARRGGRWEA